MPALNAAQSLLSARLLHKLFPSLESLEVNDDHSELWNFIVAFRQAS